MKEISIPVLWASAEFYLGALLWIGLAVVAAAFALWIVALRRNRKFGGALGRALRPAIVLGVLAGAGFAASLPALTHSAWTHVSGATDYVVIVGAGVALAAGVAYVLTPLIMLVKSPYAAK